MVVRRPSGHRHIEGADRSCDVRSVTFNGFDRRVSSVVAEPKSLGMVRDGRPDSVTEVRYLETSCSLDPLWRARSRVANDLSVYIAGSTLCPKSILPTGLD